LDKHDVLRVLELCKGKAKGIDMDELLFRTGYAISARRARLHIEALRRDGHPICGVPLAGYYMARTAKELNEGCQFLRSRAMTSLVLEAAMRRVSLPELMGQITMGI